MAQTYKCLGQLNPAATTGTALYTVPAATQTVISTLVVCNQAAAAGTFRVYLRPNDEALVGKHYLIYDAAIAANDSIFFTLGLTCDASDVLYVYASSASMSFQVFGSEIT
jgi:hypothetical protein